MEALMESMTTRDEVQQSFAAAVIAYHEAEKAHREAEAVSAEAVKRQCRYMAAVKDNAELTWTIFIFTSDIDIETIIARGEGGIESAFRQFVRRTMRPGKVIVMCRVDLWLNQHDEVTWASDCEESESFPIDLNDPKQTAAKVRRLMAAMKAKFREDVEQGEAGPAAAELAAAYAALRAA